MFSSAPRWRLLIKHACASAFTYTWRYELLTHAAGSTHTTLLPRFGSRGFSWSTDSPGYSCRVLPGTGTAHDLKRGSLYRLFHRLRVSYRDLKNTTVHRVRLNYSARAHSRQRRYSIRGRRLACRVSTHHTAPFSSRRDVFHLLDFVSCLAVSPLQYKVPPPLVVVRKPHTAYPRPAPWAAEAGPAHAPTHPPPMPQMLASHSAGTLRSWGRSSQEVTHSIPYRR